MIRAIIFDCFGVLTTDTWRAFVDTLPPEADSETARELNRAYDAGLIGREEFLEGVQEATGQQPRQVESRLSGEISKNEALLNYIRELKPHYKIGMISNIAINWIRDTFLTEEEQELFDMMVMSFETGMTKPDPRIYTLAAERLRVTAEEAVMIDDIETFVTAAKDLGMKGIVYKDLEQMKRELEALLDT